ncbi:uncharacterized protein At4g10930 isoform X2 [Malania oleifera]|nr:uncharacterized protein At4g10930 isoform X2 [Malania oleifera]
MPSMHKCDQANAGSEYSVRDAFSGKVSVSVADAGETAVVVSMVEENQETEEPNEKFSILEIEDDLKIGTFSSTYDVNSPNLEMSLKQMTNIQPNLEAQELKLSLSQDPSFNLPLTSSVNSKLKTSCGDKAMIEPSGFDRCRISPKKLLDESHVKELSESEVNMDLQLGLSVGSFLSVSSMPNDGAKDKAIGDVLQHHRSDEQLSSVNKIEPDADEDVVAIAGVKRKHSDCSDKIHTSTEDGEIKADVQNGVSAKRIKTKRGARMISSNDLTRELVSEVSQKCLSAISEDDKSKNIQNENASLDIMSIVQGSDHRPIKGLMRPHPADKVSKETENAAGLRVKKIMRIASEDKESSVIVQKLRKEIREAVRNKSSADLGKNLLDPKLLAAFRAVVTGPRTEPVKKLSPSVVKVKKLMLQKGRTRDNLTKKIYGTSSGRRRRAWDRDCQIEFWKHRCMRITKPEKIETLKSVLGLLTKSADSGDIEQSPKCVVTNPILSRLYLADTSVFPRKDDIKPLSILKADGNLEQNKEPAIRGEAHKISLDNSTVKLSETNKVLPQMGIPSLGKKGNSNNLSCVKAETASGKVHPNGCPQGPSVSLSGGSKVNLQKEMVPKSDDIKSDKRKWAMEVLARRTAVAGKSETHEKQDSVLLKGNYLLLAQLPVDMRPILAPSRHNKIPVSVRQAQLYRLTEHFLKKANLPVICRTAVTELAVADAINIEKVVADRSNSKLVYVNLCSQELLHHSEHSRSLEATEVNPSPSSVVSTSGSKQINTESSTDPAVEEALRNAGLLSDSPTGSPHHDTKELDEDNNSTKIIGEGPSNVFEMDSNTELDIYGDFEYDLEDEDYMGATAGKFPKLQPEEGESKMKVVFSTHNTNPSNAVDSKGFQSSVEVPKESHCSLEQHASTGVRCSSTESRTDTSYVPPESLHGEGEEPSLAECEELYGPDREPLAVRFQENVPRNMHDLVDAEALTKRIAAETEGHTEKAVAFTGQNSSVRQNSPNPSQKAENFPREKKDSTSNMDKLSDGSSSVHKKVEAYIKEHIRPLCKSGIITTEQYRWAVAKTTDKVMKYHLKAKNANFLVKEGEKVKKLAEQYVEAAQQKE